MVYPTDHSNIGQHVEGWVISYMNFIDLSEKYSQTKMNVVEMLQKQFNEAATSLQTVQRDYSKVLQDRQTLDSQLNENRQVNSKGYIKYEIILFLLLQVKEELDLAGDGTKVFKLIGPALINQDLTEAKGNVEKRIDYISGELKRKDDLLATMDKKQDEAREKMQEVQMQMQKLQNAPN